MRWPSLLIVVLLGGSARADDVRYAQFLFGGGELDGALDEMGGAGRLRVVSGRRDDRWANEESFTWDSGAGESGMRHGIVSYGLAKKRYLRFGRSFELYARGSFGVALLDGAQVGPNVGLASGVQFQAPVSKLSLTLAVIVEVGVETAYLLPAEIDASFGYFVSGFSVGTDFDF